MAVVNAGEVNIVARITGVNSSAVIREFLMFATTGDIDSDGQGSLVLTASGTATLTFSNFGIDTGAKIIIVKCRDKSTGLSKPVSMLITNTTGNQTIVASDFMLVVPSTNNITIIVFTAETGNDSEIQYLIGGN